MDADVRAFLNKLPREVREITSALRAQVLQIAPQTEESIVWGNLSYHRPWVGGRVKGAVCQIVVKGDRVRLDFIHGIRLPDPLRLLQGNGVSKRFIPIDNVAQITRSGIAALIRSAVNFDPDTEIELPRS